MRVLVAGAGPTGLTAAVELARQGITPTVIDKKDAPSTLSRAVGILPRSLGILEPSGVTDRLLAEGIKVRRIRPYFDSRLAATLSLDGGHSERDFGLALAQDRTEAALRDAFVELGGEVQYGRGLVGLRQENERVIAEIDDGRERDCDYLIGADGIRSVVRETLGVEFIGHDLPETWSIADVDATDWPNAGMFTFCMLSGGRVVVIVPLEAERYRIVSNTDKALETIPLEMNIQHIRREGQFTISIRQVPEYSVGRVYLAGDAAHCHSPAGGRGMNLGIADAAELAQRIVDGNLAGYSASRHAEGAATIRTSEQARQILTSPRLTTRTLVRTVCAAANLLTPLQRVLAKRFLDS